MIYPDNWDEIRREAIARDRHKCVLCGSPKRLEVHHTRESSILETLMTLCYSCHNNWANSRSGFKKRFREFNELRLNLEFNQSEINSVREKLIEDINHKRKEFVERILSHSNVDQRIKESFKKIKGEEAIHDLFRGAMYQKKLF